MALTNLTFGDGTNKALLCGLRPFMRALVAQLLSPSDDLVQVMSEPLTYRGAVLVLVGQELPV